MDQQQLRSFEPLYQTARYLGADDLLRRYLGLADGYVLPLGLAHGVDYGQMHTVLDAHGIEPLYWAYNPALLGKAAAVKPAVAIPHPFLLAIEGLPAERGQGRLVVGPPPGSAHDRDLLPLLGDAADTTILVKPKQNHGRSAAFWREHGFQVVTIADEGPPSYLSMARLFSRYERIAGCTFSSVLFFAAVMAKPVDLIPGLRCRVWEIPQIGEIFDFDSEEGRRVGRVFAGDDQTAKSALARTILGAEFDLRPATIRAGLERAIDALEEPLHFAGRYPRPLRALLAGLARRLDRPGLVMRRLSDLPRQLVARKVILQELDEVSLWLDGPTPRNPRLSVVPFRAGLTIPGDAVDGYAG